MPDTVETYVSDISTYLGSFPLFTGANDVGQAQIELSLSQALEEFSKDQPRLVVEDEVGDSGSYYNTTLLASWELDFSYITQIDYDAGTRVSGDEVAEWLTYDDGDWILYKDPTGTFLFFPEKAPASTTTFRVYYTAYHTLNGTTSTVPRRYKVALKYLALAQLMTMLAIRATKSTDSPLGLGYNATRTRAEEFERMERMFREMYVRSSGGVDIPAEGVYREFDQRFVDGKEYIFHGSRAR